MKEVEGIDCTAAVIHSIVHHSKLLTVQHCVYYQHLLSIHLSILSETVHAGLGNLEPWEVAKRKV